MVIMKRELKLKALIIKAIIASCFRIRTAGIQGVLLCCEPIMAGMSHYVTMLHGKKS